MKILLAEDTIDLNNALTTVLKHEEYDVDNVFDGQEALEHLDVDSYDCIILDVMMPKKDGIEVLTTLREKHILTPVLMLTAKSEIEDRVAGLDAGADDYLTKPFAIKELLARVRALTRRKTDYSTNDLTYKNIKLNAASLELSSENTVRLSIKEFELLQVLILNNERYLEVPYLIEKVWNNDGAVKPDTVSLYISYLKRKLFAVSSSVEIVGDMENGYKLD
ncbi:MAG: response regulator transcription factor [Lachnospiraceae bacterium]|nr:response regulator transcription factor [Lachnospiraceae bacterium]